MKKKWIGPRIVVSVCLIAGMILLLYVFYNRTTGPGRDIEAIEKYLSKFSNDWEELVKQDVAIINMQETFQSMSPWDAFLKKEKKGKRSNVILAYATDEGDWILSYLHYDGVDYLLVTDTTRDSFGTPLYNVEKFTGLYEFTEETKSDAFYEYHVILSNTPVESVEHGQELFLNTYTAYEEGRVDIEAEFQPFPSFLIHMSRPKDQ